MAALAEKPEELTRIEQAVAALADGRPEDSLVEFTLTETEPERGALRLRVWNGSVSREASAPISPLGADMAERPFDGGPDDARLRVISALWEQVRREV